MEEDNKKLPATLEEMNVRFIKLMNGESIIAYVHSLDSEYSIGLEEPMKVVTNEDHEYVLSPWLPFSSNAVHALDYSNIVMDTPVDTPMKAQYMKIVLDTLDDLEDDIDTTLH